MHNRWRSRSAKCDTVLAALGSRARRAFRPVISCCMLMFALGCHSSGHSPSPSIHFIQVPKHVGIGGPADFDPFKGTVSHSKPGQKIMLYSLTEGTWWVQPFGSHGYTDIAPDGSWSNVSHLGEKYAALLVNENYRLPVRLANLPAISGDVLAIETTLGDFHRPPDPKPIHFSGYDWKVRSGGGDIGGAYCNYEASNVWVDAKGYLHVLMNEEGEQWHCAGLTMTHSLGYGTYRFAVSDSSQFPPSATFDMFMRPDHEDPDERSGFSIALGQKGKEGAPNAAFVIQPYYVPGNSVRFSAPSGTMSYTLRWDPGVASFKSFTGVSQTPHGSVKEQVFRSGIPIPAEETVHFNFYDFHHSQSGLHHPVEIVVQKFEYLP